MRSFQKATIKDVAKHAGVSTTTVSYFVSGRESVCSPETASRIREAIEKLHYTPNSLTRGLRQRRTDTIGVCMLNPLEPHLRYGNAYFERLWRGVLYQANAERLSLLHYPSVVRRSCDGWDVFLDGRVDGVLFYSGSDSHAGRVANAGMPIVVIGRSHDLPEGGGAVFADDSMTADVALSHLWSLGHRRIAHLAGPVEHSPGADEPEPEEIAVGRLEAYVEWMRSRSMFDPSLIVRTGSWQHIGDATFVERWLAMSDPPTAVFCANDALAIDFMNRVTSLGGRIPEKFAVVGVDNFDSARVSVPPLTSVHVPVEEIGREAVLALLRVMSGAAIQQCRVAVPVTDIAVRESTAPSA